MVDLRARSRNGEGEAAGVVGGRPSEKGVVVGEWQLSCELNYTRRQRRGWGSAGPSASSPGIGQWAARSEAAAAGAKPARAGLTPAALQLMHKTPQYTRGNSTVPPLCLHCPLAAGQPQDIPARPPSHTHLTLKPVHSARCEPPRVQFGWVAMVSSTPAPGQASQMRLFGTEPR